MDWNSISGLSWIGTTLVALGGLAATVWTARRSGQVQLLTQDKQLRENRSILEWQERRMAYQQFLKVFQEYVDKITTKYQVDWMLQGGAPDLLHTVTSSLSEEQSNEMKRDIESRVQEAVGALTIKEMLTLQTQIADAANQARLIAPVSVRKAIDSLMAIAKDDEVVRAVVQDSTLTDFLARVEESRQSLSSVMSEDLIAIPHVS